jgi:hypothetical protein
MVMVMLLVAWSPPPLIGWLALTRRLLFNEKPPPPPPLPGNVEWGEGGEKSFAR